MYKGVSKSSRTVLVKRSLLTLDVKSSITFRVLPFCTNTVVPAFLLCLEASLEVPFWNCVRYLLPFLLNLFSGVECLTLHSKLQLGEEEKVTGGQIGWVWWMGDHCHVVLGQKLRNFKDLWAGALSWWIMRFWFCHFCGLLRRTFSRNLLRTSE